MARLAPLLATSACALALAGCGSSTSTSSFKGVEHEAAQAVASLQSHASSGEGDKICKEDLAKPIVERLGGVKGCESAIKKQLAQIDNLEATIESVTVAPAGTSATAHVKSTRYGKSTVSDVSLVKEGGSWKVSGP